MSIARDEFGHYSTDLFTEEAVDRIVKHNRSRPLFLYLAHLAVHSANEYEPLQAPASVIDKFSHIKDPNRRRFAGTRPIVFVIFFFRLLVLHYRI